MNGEGLLESHYISILFLVFDADPKVTRHDRSIRADGELSQFKLFLSTIQHAGVDEANVWDAAKFFTVEIHCFLDLYTQGGTRVVVKP